MLTGDDGQGLSDRGGNRHNKELRTSFLDDGGSLELARRRGDAG
jgi:hypothetical protein